MNTLVIYDSQFGNTEVLARIVANSLTAAGTCEAKRVSSVRRENVADKDLIIFASPTVSWRELPAMQSFLEGLTPVDLKGKKIACFETVMHLPKFIKGSAVKSMLAKLSLVGAAAPVSTESFFVMGRDGPLQKGEEQRAEKWAKSIVE